MPRKLKIWNGAGYCCRNNKDQRWKDVPFNDAPHAFVCAYSRADARRVIAEYTGYEPGDAEIRDYWSEGAWGKSMEGVEPERGLWLQFDSNEKPVRVV
jgi:hypothetical protein